MPIFDRCRLSLLCGMAVGFLTACSTFSPNSHDDVATVEIATRINNGMLRLGASPARGECYANRIAGSLLGDEAADAANLIEKANSKDDMRESVIASGAPVRQAFIRAHFGCSLSG